jgi:hypothetical protein
MILALAITASAGDKILETTVDSATVALTQNGAEYVRLIVSEERNLNGKRSIPAMAFGELVPQAKELKAGDTLKAVVNFRDLADGRQSYTILSFLE